MRICHKYFILYSESLSITVRIRLNVLRASRCRGDVSKDIAFLSLSVFLRARVTRPKYKKKIIIYEYSRLDATNTPKFFLFSFFLIKKEREKERFKVFVKRQVNHSLYMVIL